MAGRIGIGIGIATARVYLNIFPDTHADSVASCMA
jgi:hypothetical protein